MKTMYVRNTQPGPTVFDEGEYEIQWAGKGDPAGEDMQVVPEELVESYTFQRCLNLGVFAVEESSEDAAETLAKAKEIWDRRNAQKRATTLNDLQAPQHEAVPMENPTAASNSALAGHVSQETGVNTSNDEKHSAIHTEMPVKMMPRGAMF